MCYAIVIFLLKIVKKKPKRNIVWGSYYLLSFSSTVGLSMSELYHNILGRQIGLNYILILASIWLEVHSYFGLYLVYSVDQVSENSLII